MPYPLRALLHFLKMVAIYSTCFPLKLVPLCGLSKRERERERERERMTILYSFLFLMPPSLFVTVMSVVSFTSSSNLGLSELRGKHVEYSKFWAANNPGNKKQLPSKIGMLVSYTPALVAALASLAFLGDAGPRRFLLSSALSIHFFKRVFEVARQYESTNLKRERGRRVLFIHRYSGHMSLESTIMISSSYLITTITMIYAQHLTRDMAEPVFNLKYTGVVLFLVGITGNFYHHYLLSKLRKKDDRGYKIPRGGLFELVVCPHYLFEIVGFMGVAFISQTIYAFSFTLGSMFYLIGRSYSTRKWYISKFQNFPTGVKALIPYIF